MIVECARYEREREVVMKVVIEEWGVEYFNERAENADRNMSVTGHSGETECKSD